MGEGNRSSIAWARGLGGSRYAAVNASERSHLCCGGIDDLKGVGDRAGLQPI
jgi:hypothetical protein